jgi:hypothetical protein
MGMHFLKSSQVKNNHDLVPTRQESMRSMILIQGLRLSESRDSSIVASTGFPEYLHISW